MIDTVKYLIDNVPKFYLNKIENKLKYRSCVDRVTGELDYEFSTGDVKASYDSSININITKSGTLAIQCSLHKIIVGHNSYGGSDNLILLSNCLKKILQDYFEVKLPDVKLWRITKIDYSLVFDLENNDNVRLYINSLKNCTYRSRQTNHYDTASNNGISIPGQTTTVKFYNKLLEFMEHDYKKLKKQYDELKMSYFLEKINGILRIEVSVKNKLLKTIFPKSKYKKTMYKLYEITKKEKGLQAPETQYYINRYNTNVITVGDVDMNLIKSIWESEVKKVIKVSGEKIVNTNNLVLEQLNKLYPAKTSNTLYAFWVFLSTRGEEFARINYKKSTFYKYRKMLMDSGISWTNTDIQIKTASNVIDFTPSLYNKRMKDLNQVSYEFKNNVYNLLNVI